MENKLVQTIYNGERYAVPYCEMGSWLEYVKALSYFEKDAGNLQIAFSDKFSQYRIPEADSRKEKYSEEALYVAYQNGHKDGFNLAACVTAFICLVLFFLYIKLSNLKP